jgi:hypothetical protein
MAGSPFPIDRIYQLRVIIRKKSGIKIGAFKRDAAVGVA